MFIICEQAVDEEEGWHKGNGTLYKQSRTRTRVGPSCLRGEEEGCLRETTNFPA